MAAENPRLEPYVAVVGEDSDSLQAYLIVDKLVIDELNMDDLPFTLLAAFFVYNICYPKGCTNFYTFLEILLLNDVGNISTNNSRRKK